MTESAPKSVQKHPSWRNALNRLRELSAMRKEAEQATLHLYDDESHPARERVQYWLSFLSPRQAAAEKPLSRELQLVARTVASITEAQESQILTKDEAEAVVQFILSKFIERRFNKTIHEVLNGPEQEWLLTASRYFHE